MLAYFWVMTVKGKNRTPDRPERGCKTCEHQREKQEPVTRYVQIYLFLYVFEDSV
jgi:hypothetical protein